MFSLESGGNQSLVSECYQQQQDRRSLFSPLHDSILEFGGNKLVNLDSKTLSTFVSCNHIGIREGGK